MIHKILSSLLWCVGYILSPPLCLSCKKNLEIRVALCDDCAKKIMPIVPFDCYYGKGKYAKIFAISAYQEPLRSLILAKHHKNHAHVSLFANFIVDYCSTLQDLDFDYIVPVPLHWTRYAARGFNQGEIFANAISQTVGKPVLPVVRRLKKTAYQASLSLEKREFNMENAFCIDEQYFNFIQTKKFLIVDDLFTTGSTVRSIAQLLDSHGAFSVDVFVVCRVVAK